MAAINKAMSCGDTLPRTGLRQYSEISKFLPMRKTKLYGMVKAGLFPKPVIVESMTCWRLEDVWNWIEAQGKNEKKLEEKGEEK